MAIYLESQSRGFMFIRVTKVSLEKFKAAFPASENIARGFGGIQEFKFASTEENFAALSALSGQTINEESGVIKLTEDDLLRIARAKEIEESKKLAREKAELLKKLAADAKNNAPEILRSIIDSENIETYFSDLESASKMGYRGKSEMRAAINAIYKIDKKIEEVGYRNDFIHSIGLMSPARTELVKQYVADARKNLFGAMRSL